MTKPVEKKENKPPLDKSKKVLSDPKKKPNAVSSTNVGKNKENPESQKTVKSAK